MFGGFWCLVFADFWFNGPGRPYDSDLGFVESFAKPKTFRLETGGYDMGSSLN